MNDKHLKLTIKKKQANESSSGKMADAYDVFLNDWNFGRGVTGLNLDMPAGEKPRLTIDVSLDEVDIEKMFPEITLNK